MRERSLILPIAAGIDIGHPFHLHGYVFRAVAMSPLEGPIYLERLQAMNEAGEIVKRFDGPLRDTIVVPGRGYAVIRFIADNPGTYLTQHKQVDLRCLYR